MKEPHPNPKPKFAFRVTNTSRSDRKRRRSKSPSPGPSILQRSLAIAEGSANNPIVIDRSPSRSPSLRAPSTEAFDYQQLKYLEAQIKKRLNSLKQNNIAGPANPKQPGRPAILETSPEPDTRRRKSRYQIRKFEADRQKLVDKHNRLLGFEPKKVTPVKNPKSKSKATKKVTPAKNPKSKSKVTKSNVALSRKHRKDYFQAGSGFKKHTMYHPKTGQAIHVKTLADHQGLEALGYLHGDNSYL